MPDTTVPRPSAARAKVTRERPPASAKTESGGAASAPPPFPRSEPVPDKFATGLGGKPRPEPKKRATTKSARLEQSLEELFSACSLPFVLIGDDHCATILANGAPRMASAWVALADENPGVKRVLEKLTEGSAWGGVIIATASVVVPIAAHHGAPMGPLSNILGGPSSAPERAPQPPSGTRDSSAMGAPAPRDPFPQGVDPTYAPNVPEGSPPGVVTVGGRNAAASGANGAAAY